MPRYRRSVSVEFSATVEFETEKDLDDGLVAGIAQALAADMVSSKAFEAAHPSGKADGYDISELSDECGDDDGEGWVEFTPLGIAGYSVNETDGGGSF